MKVRIHPDFASYEHFIKSIPQEKYTVEQVFCNNRNTVTKVEVDGHIFVIKKYKVPTLFNRVVYTWIRKSKARRSFEYANRLLASGIETAGPVAYIEERKKGFFHTGYFISEFIPYPMLPESKKLDEEERALLYSQFIEFTAHLHQIKIIHKDYNDYNVLYHKVDNKYNFALIDINRMDFGKDNLTLWMQSVNQLDLSVVERAAFVEKYAEIRNLDVTNCLIALFKNYKNRQHRDKAKILLKKIIRGVH